MKSKYPKTLHLPWSESVSRDDRVLQDKSVLEASPEVVVTEKMDGENTTLMSDCVFHRSLDPSYHSSRDYVKAFQAMHRWQMKEGFRYVGEYLFARHSIAYSELSSYFLLLAVYDESGVSLPWDVVASWASKFSIETVPVLYRGPWCEENVKACFSGTSRCGGEQEGYVVRTAGSIGADSHSESLAKFVRKGHVQTDEHWMHGRITLNGLKG